MGETQRLNSMDAPGERTRLTIRRSAGGAGHVAEIDVPAATVQGLRTQIGNMRGLAGYDKDPDRYEMACEAIIELAAPDLAAALRTASQLPEGGPALIIVRGLQLDDTPITTPLDGVFTQSAAPVEAALLAGSMRLYGLGGVAFAHENGGRLFRAVCPVPAASNTESSQGAAADLRRHSDNGHYAIGGSNDTHPYRFPVVNPYQWFATLTPAEATPMRVKLNADVLQKLDPRGGDPAALAEFSQLQEPAFRFCSPPSHGTVHRIEPLPVLVKLDEPGLGYAMRFHAGTVEGITPQADAALELLRHACDRAPEEVILTQRGDLIGYDNRRVTHRREPYEAHFDGTDRFYVRVYGQAIAEVLRWAPILGGNGRVA